MNTKPTLTIGIPAYNEEANIVFILEDILKQKVSNVKIEKIIVASDNSSDQTNSLVKMFKSQNVALITSKKREGQAKRQNDIFKKSTSDILVLLNADIRITDKKFLEKLIKPILKSEADLTSSYPTPLPPQGYVENILHTSVNIKTHLFNRFKNGNNIYTCHGRARAFSKQLYKKMKFKDSVGEDAYSYMYTKWNGFLYKNVPSAKVIYKLPENVEDHKKQSIRFMQTKDMLSKIFGTDATEYEYKIPLSDLLLSFFLVFLKEPTRVVSYVGLFMYMKIKSITEDITSDTWSTSRSSKTLQLKGAHK